jgi:hypothetical protein
MRGVEATAEFTCRGGSADGCTFFGNLKKGYGVRRQLCDRRALAVRAWQSVASVPSVVDFWNFRAKARIRAFLEHPTYKKGLFYRAPDNRM